MKIEAAGTRSGIRPGTRVFFQEYILMGQTPSRYLRSLVTPMNALAAVILVVGFAVIVARFAFGLGAVTNLSDANPWGLWLGVGVLCGVALAAGGYTMGITFYVIGMKEFRPLLRSAILTAFLGYVVVIVGLMFDLGRPWRLPYPLFISFGLSSVLFLVSWHFALYLLCAFMEFVPTFAEWLNLRRLRNWAEKLALWTTIVGAVVATGHQSALGALFLLAPEKLHPLWYSPLLPIFFFISSIAAGLCMVIVESTITHAAFSKQIPPEHHAELNRLTLGLAKAGSVILFAYFWLKIVGIAAGNSWSYLNTGPGYWFMVEMFLLVLLPSFLLLLASQERSIRLARVAALLAVVGIVVNRLNVSIIAFNWQAHTYVPKWSEVVVTITLVTALIVAFRWIVNRMPVLQEHPDFKEEH